MSSEQQKVAIITGASQGIGASIVAAYRAKAFTEYTQDSQPAGLTADYAVLETRRLAGDLVLGYLSVDFSFPARPPLTVYLSIIVHRVGGTWLISHYQVSRLTDPVHDH
jgi:NAD(P)-dependent dehydrogenase (short-subunit alcohol dehydrogenase family)